MIKTTAQAGQLNEEEISGNANAKIFVILHNNSLLYSTVNANAH